jgi:hypothetical protein
MTDTSPDIPRLRKVLDLIRSLPVHLEGSGDYTADSWSQADWMNYGAADATIGAGYATITDSGVVSATTGLRCGTAACFAGWAVLMFAPHGTLVLDEEYVKLPGQGQGPVHIADYAMELLGLDTDQAETLFAAWNGLSALETTVDELEREAGGI